MGLVDRLRRRLRGGDSEGEAGEETSAIRGGVQRKLHARRPPNTAFRQQRLKAWQPLFNSLVVRLGLVIVGLLFIGIGVGLTVAHKMAHVVEIDYSECATAGSQYAKMPGKWVSGVAECEWYYDEGQCHLKFDSPFKGKTYLYYKLTNFYQNHRKYVDSFDWNQLRGEAVAAGDLNSKCGPLSTNAEGKPIYPCGLIANSMFNDTYASEGVEWDQSDIAWASDRSTYKASKYAPEDVVPPPNWAEQYPNGYTQESLEAVGTNQHLMVWMKTAALPKFVKLWGVAKEFGGDRELVVGDNFPTAGFGGRKGVIFTSGTKSVAGGAARSLGLAISFFVAGGVSALFGVLFTLA